MSEEQRGACSYRGKGRLGEAVSKIQHGDSFSLAEYGSFSLAGL